MIYIDFPAGAGKWLLGCWDPRVLICRTSSLKLPTAPAFEPSSTVLHIPARGWRVTNQVQDEQVWPRCTGL